MLGSTFEGTTTLRTIVRGFSRWGSLCIAIGAMVFVAGCPFVPADPCASADCNDDDNCTTDTCDVVDGAAECSNDAVVCTDGVCNPDDGECVECLTDADCTQGFCSEAGGNVCVECITDAQCDDSNDCTADTCANATCSNTNITGTCDDGDVCTSADACVDGVCTGTPVANCCNDNADCDDGVFCNGAETCNTATGDCNASPGDPCAPPTTCNEDTNTCDAAPACTADVDCDDGDVCTDDACVNGACENTNNTAACNDGDSCTTGDVCADGACAGAAVTCPAGQSCNPANGNCEDITCTSAADCNDGLACTTDVCNLGTGNCEYTNIDSACNDGQFCSGTWTCDPGNGDADARGCVSTGNPCNNPTPVCNEATNACDACTTAAQCNDDVPCTQDTCVAGSCNNNPINANCPNPANCDGVDFCDPNHPDADVNGCVQPGNPCAPQLCVEATYVVGDPNTCTDCTSNSDCNDNITCTLDTCNGVTGACSNVATNAECPDAVFCNGVDFCDPNHPNADGDGCVSGLPAYPCANACNENTDTCFNCTSNSECNDGIACTDDTCNGGTGACSHVDNCGLLNCNYQTGQCE